MVIHTQLQRDLFDAMKFKYYSTSRYYSMWCEILHLFLLPNLLPFRSSISNPLNLTVFVCRSENGHLAMLIHTPSMHWYLFSNGKTDWYTCLSSNFLSCFMPFDCLLLFKISQINVAERTHAINNVWKEMTHLCFMFISSLFFSLSLYFLQSFIHNEICKKREFWLHERTVSIIRRLKYQMLGCCESWIMRAPHIV